MKSSFSTGNSNCVGVRPYRASSDIFPTPDFVTVYNTKDLTIPNTIPGASVMEVAFTRDEWDAFIAGVKNGEFDWDKIFEEADAG